LFLSLAMAQLGKLLSSELPLGGLMARFYIDQAEKVVGSTLISFILGGLTLIGLVYGLLSLPKPNLNWQWPNINNPFKRTLSPVLHHPEPQEEPQAETQEEEPQQVLPQAETQYEEQETIQIESITPEVAPEPEPVTEPIINLEPVNTEAPAPEEVAEPETAGLSFEVHTATNTADDIPVAQKTVAGDDPYDPSLDLRNYKFPTLDLLDQRSHSDITIDKNELENNKNQIINTLKSFGIAIAKISATVGPTVTLYEIVPAEGVRISKIRNLEDDIALSLSALGIRIIAPIPGKGTIGIEVPNLKKQFVSMRTLIASDKFVNNDHSLPIALGKRIDNENYIVDLAKMPHLLMAGATGQGKSVGINTILVSLLYKKHPSQLKFVMVDPKKVELSVYRLIEKHFLAKLPNEDEAIITDTKKVINTLNALCIEMDNRYDLLKDAGVRNIREYNEKFIQRRLLPTKGHKYLPFIVLVVDEFADLIMTAGKEVELPIARIAQLARAVGIHCIIATQRPSVNVITGTIKANFPARVAFKVSAKVDSRTILDAGGAEQLIGQGDMLILNGSELVRLQCAFVDTPEVERIVEFIGQQQGYPEAFELPEYEGADGGDLGGGSSSKSLKEVDAMFEQCARLVVTSGSGSTSMLQRRFNLGYNRAGRIMDQLEAAGIVGPGTGGKPRDVMVHTEAELEDVLRVIIK
jgi:S-DNA-T family DNA segregation ATPase FtsK/SpoIIIE